MTFFNKKTEVMNIEMTPYGRYLYSIGKFMPYSYEFVDDDILYKSSGSAEKQEVAHQRILNDTPKFKSIRSFRNETPRQSSVTSVSTKVELQKTINQRENGLYALGRSSYSSNNIPSFQINMLKGDITSCSNMFETNRVYSGGKAEDISGSVFIPQVNLDFTVQTTLKNTLNPDQTEGESLTSITFDDGTFVDVSYEDVIFHLKEFNSFYEKENFEFEVFLSQSDGTYKPLKMEQEKQFIVNDLLSDGELEDITFETREDDFMRYYFDIEVDTEIPREELCEAIQKLEINNQFLDEELICPDQRSERFDIYSTRVGPEDLEDCDD